METTFGRLGRPKRLTWPKNISQCTVLSTLCSKIAASTELFLNIEKFMEEVQKYDCFHNKFSPDYKNKFVRFLKSLEKIRLRTDWLRTLFWNIRRTQNLCFRPSSSIFSSVKLPQQTSKSDEVRFLIFHRHFESQLRAIRQDFHQRTARRGTRTTIWKPQTRKGRPGRFKNIRENRGNQDDPNDCMET